MSESRRRTRVWRRPGVALLAALLCLSGCARQPRWETRALPTEDVLASLLGLTPEANFQRDILASEVPEVPVRARLRPCCAFGAGLQTDLGSVPVPGVKLENVISVDDLGPHTYDSGLLTVQGSAGELVSAENNGLLYTCRGGFIDTAHVRDYADWLLFVAAAVARNLETGATIEFPDEGGKRRIVFEPVDPALLAAYGRRHVTVPLAEWLTFQLSIWHEIATWFGWSSIKLFPEYPSAFSPEDLYSNLLGIKIGAAIIYMRAAPTDLLYERSADRFTRATLELLDAVPAAGGIEAVKLVDGVWWDSTKRLPNKELVRRRYMDIEAPLAPWRVTDVGRSEAVASWEGRYCRERNPPVTLSLPSGIGGVDFAALARLEIEVEEGLPQEFPFPRPGSRLITQADYPEILRAIREQNRAEFGPLAERPDGAAPAD